MGKKADNFRKRLMAKFRVKSTVLLLALTVLGPQSSVSASPRADIVSSNEHVVVSWPVSPLGFVLETLETGGWFQNGPA